MAPRKHPAATEKAMRSPKTKRSLERYQWMRDFTATAEPWGEAHVNAKTSIPGKLPFVVQKHAATRLHYDFRLGWDGVLKSWAVTKGPSYYPGDKRLAVRVEDHPWEYRDFEGTIPKGQYGGGTVMVWDKGNWIPHGDVDQGLRDGHLKFALHGKKLKGGWVLVRMRGRAGDSGKTNWLLIKEKDKFARESGDEPIIDEEPKSAASGRTMEEIATRKGRVWNSKEGNGARAARTADSGRDRGAGAMVPPHTSSRARRAPNLKASHENDSPDSSRRSWPCKPHPPQKDAIGFTNSSWTAIGYRFKSGPAKEQRLENSKGAALDS